MMRIAVLCFSILAFGFLNSCGSKSDSTENNTVAESDTLISAQEPIQLINNEAQIIEPQIDDEVLVLEKGGITLTEIKTQDFPEASIELLTKTFEEGSNKLNYEVEGVQEYKIGLIENNYLMGYQEVSSFSKEFLYGNNVFLSFLTTEKNTVLKTNAANELKNVIVGEMDPLFDMDQPHLFFHLPLEKSDVPVLDFCLVNTKISEAGNKVAVTINDTRFLIDKWAAFEISGLTKEENTIRIQLVDENGVLIDGPFNDSGERSFMVNTSTS